MGVYLFRPRLGQTQYHWYETVVATILTWHFCIYSPFPAVIAYKFIDRYQRQTCSSSQCPHFGLCCVLLWCDIGRFYPYHPDLHNWSRQWLGADQSLLVYWCIYASLGLNEFTISGNISITFNGPLAIYMKLRIAHAPECRERFLHHRGLAILTYIAARDR